MEALYKAILILHRGFFCEIGPKLAENIPISTKSYKDYLGNEMEENFVYKNITKDVILDKGCK